MLPYDAVIFDLDGTLTDSQPGIYACTAYALQKLGLPVPSDTVLRRFIGPPLADSFMRYCGMTEAEATHATELYRERYIPIGWKENKVYPRIRALLAALKQQGVYLAVATGKPEHTSIEILRYFGLLPYLNAVAGPSNRDMHADKAALIRRVLPEGKKAVMVGDTAGDILGAQKCGIDAIAALYGYGDKEEMLSAHPAHIAEDPSALCNLLCPGMPEPKGYFITLEGGDGSGKTTQQNALAQQLEQFGYSVRCTREPGGCALAESIRGLLLTKEDSGMCPETEALLFAAARAQHLREVILPAVRQGQIVLCDRFVDSSLVYQGCARGLGMAWIREINRLAFQEGMPNATLYLKISYETALSRRLAVSVPDRIEQAGEAFHARTAEAFTRLSEENPDRFITVSADLPPKEVTETAFGLLFERMIREGVL